MYAYMLYYIHIMLSIYLSIYMYIHLYLYLCIYSSVGWMSEGCGSNKRDCVGIERDLMAFTNAVRTQERTSHDVI